MEMADAGRVLLVFGVLLVVGLAIALLCALTAGAAALALTQAAPDAKSTPNEA